MLVLALVTAAGGLVMAALWVAGGGLQQRDPSLQGLPMEPVVAQVTGTRADASRFPFWLVAGHAAMAVIAIAIWIGVASLGEDADAGVAWVAVGVFVLAAFAGMAMFRHWKRDRGGDHAYAEQRIPGPLAYVHGLAGLATLVLAVLAAAGVGD